MSWPLVPLGAHVEILSGFAFDSELFSASGDIPIVRIRDVVPGSSKTFFTGNADPAYLVSDGDMLIGMDGNFNRGTWTGGPALLNQRVCRIKAISLSLDDRYLYHFLPRALQLIEDRTSFATVKHLSVKSVRSILIPLPPLPEQRRTASILDQADALRQLNSCESATLADLEDRLVRGTFANSTSSVPLAQHLQFLTSGSRGWAKFYSDAGPRFIRIQDVGRGRILPEKFQHVLPPDSKEAERTKVQAHDVLLSITADLGRAAVVTDELAGSHVSQHLALLRLVDIKSRFVAAYLSSAAGRNQLMRMNRGATKQGLNFDDIRSIRIPVVTPGRQEAVVAALEAFDRRNALAASRRAKLDELFAALQHRAFRGEL